jgi:hypothetical protein
MISQFVPTLKDPTYIKKTLFILADNLCRIENLPSATSNASEDIVIAQPHRRPVEEGPGTADQITGKREVAWLKY